MVNTQIINILGGSGIGKSSVASDLFRLMKWGCFSVELIGEYAKELTWEQDYTRLANQSLVFGTQAHRQNAILGLVQYVITDSPLILSPLYMKPDYPEEFKKVAIKIFKKYNNLNFFLKRCKPFVPIGRNETEEQAKENDVKLANILLEEKIPFVVVDGDERAAQEIFNLIRGK